MHVAQARLVQRQTAAVGALHEPRAFEVNRLPANHPGAANRHADLLDHAQPTQAHVRRVFARSVRREQGEGFGQQAVAGEDGERVAVQDVQRRHAAAQAVVVHRREVVVHQRVGVNHLDGAGRRHGDESRGGELLGRPRPIGAGDRLRGRQRQDGPDALAANGDAVAHRLGDQHGAHRGRWQRGVKRLFHLSLESGAIRGEHSSWRRYRRLRYSVSHPAALLRATIHPAAPTPSRTIAGKTP